jgi:hypothetical protein
MGFISEIGAQVKDLRLSRQTLEEFFMDRIRGHQGQFSSGQDESVSALNTVGNDETIAAKTKGK